MASSRRKGVNRTSVRTRGTRTGVKRTGRNEEDEQDLEKTVENYQTRLASSGVDTDTRNPLEKLLNLYLTLFVSFIVIVSSSYIAL